MLTKEQNKKVAEILSQLLADESILYLKTRNAHWNVEGPDFKTVHVYFEELYTELQVVIDDVAEKIRTKQYYAPATMSEYLELTQLKEERKEKYDSLTFIEELLKDHETICESLNKAIQEIEEYPDVATSDYLTGLLEQHQKTAWMLRSHLK
ncbi:MULTISPECIES: Dps family protein [Weeksella]|uniref:Ferritin Dps family protein n=1 Tax=Weeksella virosa (strain ATCC 43766 / DSM 16922 / JCM 21250 / CCUG 30538 / CDC 9751 / IAM 14551 / NBRC 16016 / NCTC 11634 / CL345/78) TaxID=865938 RepID=F0NYK2_WEEVC|nr:MULTISPECIES: DNA starvation/stationary phase protection protein [Weeksella]ADX67122.1 Ferritin Dps family protein [Weeksella virosa DSM 16922]MDK7375617.1 DNA starvation/stationary phase protection protein [Weeksella virosa]MDK7676249.1 DNA starvation/stationary phase protection protein [Weeksella virosa]OFM81578.1 DNA starvation/stationary phase protection protein [Weeksella sp. HMSC059D05]SUP53393.1 DNA protection during starvation protein 2 [Weeksella virosa]